ncbi:MAG: hypothetical protein AAGA56_23165 [Myxococcota bacterium]
MKEKATFEDLVQAAVDGELPDGWIYRKQDGKAVADAEYAVTTSDEDIDLDVVVVDREEYVAVLYGRGMLPWLDSATFEDVVSLHGLGTFSSMRDTSTRTISGR